MNKPIAALLLSTVFLTACDTVKAPPAGRTDTIEQKQYPQITVQDGLQPWIGINTPVVDRSGDVMKVNVPIRLLSDAGQYSHVQYRFIFLDKSGVPLRTQTDWRYTTLEPRIQQIVSANALDTTAADWRMEIRPAR